MKTILVADDLPTVRERWEQVAQRNAYRWKFHIASSGQDAIAVVNSIGNANFDLIILDVQMRDNVEGLTTLKALSGQGALIVLMTGVYDLTELAEMIVAQGIIPQQLPDGSKGTLVFPKGRSMLEEEFLEAIFAECFHDLMKKCWFI